MMLRGMPCPILCAMAIVAGALVPARAAPAEEKIDPARLFAEVQALDATFFAAYNRCDLQRVGSLLATDLEFYDDRDGLEVSRQALLDDLKKYICGKVRRELVPGTLEVHAIPGFGALQIGAHRFCDAKNPACPGDSMVSKFIHLWRKKDGAWTLTRAVSYGHP
jgi:ketosteroid isomerase-like protein